MPLETRTSLCTSQRNINETSQETINDIYHRTIYSRTVNKTSHETISETSHETTSETSHETCSEAQRTCSDMQRICPNISEAIIETCYNTDPESLKIVETSCMGTLILISMEMFWKLLIPTVHKSLTQVVLTAQYINL